MNERYPGRDGGTPQVIARRDPVAWRPWRRGAPLTQTQHARWSADGFLVRHDLFSAAELQQMQSEAQRLAADARVRADEAAFTEHGSGALRSLFRPQAHSLLISRLLADPRLLDVVEYLLDSPVYVHQSRINFKPAFRGREFWWHSDFETWHHEDGLPGMRTISVSISLTDNTPYNGPLLLMPGSHRWYVSCPAPTPADHFRASLREQTVGTPDEASLRQLASRGVEAATGPAGTVIFFDCNTMHGSPGNITPWPRSNLFFVYNSVHNTPGALRDGQRPRPAFVAERQDFRPLVRPQAAIEA